ncbi:MAG TPA: hypothetical protein VHB25_03265 [Gemmatimonadaceae bacterium]|nr:hypothetical protein [Gemmatimonadaceae bacterium]
MPYTLWSRGRLLGSSELDFAYREHGHRCGWFYPADGADGLCEIATGVSPALMKLYDDEHSRTAQADVAAAVDRYDALELELHGPNGEVVACENIGLQDCEFLLTLADGIDDDEYDAWYASLDDAARAEFDASMEHDLALFDEWFGDEPDRPWEPQVEFPRYQLLVRFAEHDPAPYETD